VKKLVETMPKTEEARVMSPEGTDITFSLKDRRFGFVYDGLCAPGEFEGIPAGCVDITPVPATGNGVIAIEASFVRGQLPRTPMRITVKAGKVTNIEGGAEARSLDKLMKKALAQGDENANQLAEFMLGLNPNAWAHYGPDDDETLIEGDRAMGAVDFGFGRNVQIGGELSGDFHWDGQMWDTSLVLDDVAMIENGIPTKELLR
jgi:leucyl aminopeptidase (aminopeptidase T)